MIRNYIPAIQFMSQIVSKPTTRSIEVLPNLLFILLQKKTSWPWWSGNKIKNSIKYYRILTIIHLITCKSRIARRPLPQMAMKMHLEITATILAAVIITKTKYSKKTRPTRPSPPMTRLSSHRKLRCSLQNSLEWSSSWFRIVQLKLSKILIRKNVKSLLTKSIQKPSKKLISKHF